MPFDSTPIFDPLTFSPGREGLRKMAHLLRHAELWPKGFSWRYSKCERCAIGLANSLWPQTSTHVFEKDFEMGSRQGHLLTIGMNHVIGKSGMDSVSPEDVADSIDRYLETGNIAAS
jgi:hypothetical protein